MNRPVIHVGDTAGVPQQLCSGLANLGWDAQSRVISLPRGPMTAVKKALSLKSRWTQARRIRAEADATDAILHVHYATSGILFRGHHPLVVHAHGTDVRAAQGLSRRVLNGIFERSDVILAATQDLLPYLPDRAQYLPNPVDTEFFQCELQVHDDAHDVFIFAALNTIKGGPELLETVAAIQKIRPETTFTAVETGDLVPEFRELGVKFVPYLPPLALRDLIHGHRIVLGQRKLGIPGTSELQALACGRPVLMPLGDHDWVGAKPTVVHDNAPVEAAEHAVALLEDATSWQEQAVLGATWVREHHATASVAQRLDTIYRALV